MRGSTAYFAGVAMHRSDAGVIGKLNIATLFPCLRGAMDEVTHWLVF